MVAFIMSRYRHDSTRAISHEDVIRNPDWDRCVVTRVDSVGTRKNTRFLSSKVCTLQIGFVGSLFNVSVNCWCGIRMRYVRNERMFGC